MSPGPLQHLEVREKRRNQKREWRWSSTGWGALVRTSRRK